MSEELKNKDGALNRSKEVKESSNVIKEKVINFWNKLNIFNKFATIGISVFILLGLIAFLSSRIVSSIIAIISIILIVVSILIEKQVIRNIKKWISIILLIVSFIIIIPYFSLFKINITDYEKYEWNDVVLANVIEKPKSSYGKIISNSDKYLSLDVKDVSKTQFADYIKICKEKGFDIDVEQTEITFLAYNKDGYKLYIYYNEINKKMSISLDAPMELGTLVWSESELAKLVPTPKSTIGKIEKDDKTSFVAYVGNINKSDYNEYVTSCSNKGFNVNSSNTNKEYIAKNENSYKILLNHVGNNIMKITIYEPEYNISVEVKCVENWIFSKYDVKLYIDDSYKGTITQGGTENYNVTLNKGKHKLKFVNVEDDNITGEETIEISKNENVKLKISCTSYGVNIEILEGTTAREENVNNTETNESNTQKEQITENNNTTNSEIETKLEKNFSKEYAKRAVVVAMTNGSAIDVFKSDGFSYDTSKFHKYSDISGFYLEIEENGTWSAIDESTWRVENMKLNLTKENKGSMIKVSADVKYDGKNYIIANGQKINANEKYIDSSDTSKISIEDLNPTESTPYLTVSKDLIADDRRNTGNSNELDEATIITSAKSTFEKYGKSKYPYGFKCHWIVDFIACEVRYDGSCYIKVGVTITNQYGTKRKTVAEGIVKGSNVKNFYVSN